MTMNSATPESLRAGIKPMQGDLRLEMVEPVECQPLRTADRKRDFDDVGVDVARFFLFAVPGAEPLVFFLEIIAEPELRDPRKKRKAALKLPVTRFIVIEDV